MQVSDPQDHHCTPLRVPAGTEFAYFTPVALGGTPLRVPAGTELAYPDPVALGALQRTCANR